MENIKLPRELVNQLLTLAQSSPEEEICGLISGTNEHYETCYPVPNIASNRQRYFEMDPKTLIRVLTDIRENGKTLKAIYHSHPRSPAIPSLSDISQHEYPGVLYLIISLNTQGVLEMRGFKIEDNQINETAITI